MKQYKKSGVRTNEQAGNGIPGEKVKLPEAAGPAKPGAFTLSVPQGTTRIDAETAVLPEDFAGPVQIPEGVEVIDHGCFKGKAITGVNLPRSLKVIGCEAFCDCRLEELVIQGNREVRIHDWAFRGNSSLDKITLGNCDVLRNAFWGCPVREITLTADCSLSKKMLGFHRFYGWDKAFGGYRCDSYDDNFAATVAAVYQGAKGRYVLKGKLVKTDYPPAAPRKSGGNGFYGCAECIFHEDKTKRCYTTGPKGGKQPDQWEMARTDRLRASVLRAVDKSSPRLDN